jgi:hypothetical protein
MSSLKGDVYENEILEGNITSKQSLSGEVSNGVVHTGGVTKELDPTVPEHVKNITEADIEKWNSGTGGGLVEETDPTVPAYVKDIKESDIENWNNKSEFSGDYDDLTNQPTKVSAFENDKGYLSSIPLEYVTETELSGKGYATESYVANKIAEAELSGSDVDLSGLATKDELNAKVDKVKGKSLIDDTEITRLASVTNYDDTEIKNQLNSKANKTDIPTVPTNISSFTNDKGYLTSVPSEYITETELNNKNYLTSIPSEYITETELNAKGYLTEHQDLSSYAKTIDIPTKVSELANDKNYITSIPSEYVTETELNNKKYLTSVPSDYKTKTENDSLYQAKGNYLTSIPSEYVTDTELNNKGYLTEHQDISNLATKTELNNAVSGKADKTSIPTKTSQLTNDSGYLKSIPSEYVTETELANKKYLTSVPSEYITETELNAKGYLTEEDIPDVAVDRLPDYWEEYLPAKIEAINNLQMAGGKDCFSFPLITDIHIRQNIGKYSGLLIKRILDNCYLPFALCVGDSVSRGTGAEAHMEEDFANAEILFKPIRSKLLQQMGNHDGAWGYKDHNGDGTKDYYAYNFNREKMHFLIYRKVGLVGECHFDSSGTGYYIDDVINKVRYIMLNSHNNVYEEDKNGFAKYNSMTAWKFQQSQFDLVIEACSSIPSDEWKVLTASHIPLNQISNSAKPDSFYANLVLMAQVLNAYKTKTKFEGQYDGEFKKETEDGIEYETKYDVIKVNVDFTSAKGEYIAHFAGHAHIDSATVFNGISIFTTRCDGDTEPSNSGLVKTKGTITEQSFDVFTVNTKEKKIYVTKIGAGDNRYWDYEKGIEFDPDLTVYNISTTLSNCTGASENSTTITEGSSITLKFTANENYELPETITVVGATPSWAKDTGILTLSNPTENVTVTIEATEIIIPDVPEEPDEPDTPVDLIVTKDVDYFDYKRMSTGDGVTLKDTTPATYVTTRVIYMAAGQTIQTSGVNFSYDKTARPSCMLYLYNYETDKYLSAIVIDNGTSNAFTRVLDEQGNLTLTRSASGGPMKIRLTGYGLGKDLNIYYVN